jgi:hypothetical protein
VIGEKSVALKINQTFSNLKEERENRLKNKTEPYGTISKDQTYIQVTGVTEDTEEKIEQKKYLKKSQKFVCFDISLQVYGVWEIPV